MALMEVKPEVTDEQFREAYISAVAATAHMADRLATLIHTMQEYQNHERSFIEPMLLYTIMPAMETLGDYLNGCDAVGEEDEQETGEAFRKMREILQPSA